MKGKYITIFAVLGFIFFFAIEAQAVDWVLYATAADGSGYCYYDSQSIKRASKDIVQVWTKTIFTEKGVQGWIKDCGPKYKELSYSISLKEYNCSEEKRKFLSVTRYNQGGGVISNSNELYSWEFITPESTDESLFNIVCGSR